MKKLFRKIKKIEKKIEQKYSYLNEVDNSEYYKIFGSETERIADFRKTSLQVINLQEKRIDLLTELKTKIENEINN